MKKSAEILGLPIISITEGRELGTSKTLLIDAKKGLVAAITLEDDEWYRGVKLIPYEAVIAIGNDAITIVHSENILRYNEVGDYEAMLDENIRVLGTKAITKNGTIQGKITEILIGDDGKIEKCEVTATDGTVTEIAADQISIFGKQVTMIDPAAAAERNSARNNPARKKSASVPANAIVEPVKEEPAPPPVIETPIVEAPVEEVAPPEMPPQEEIPPVIEEPVAQTEPEEAKPKVQQAEALRAALKRAMESQKKPAAPEPAPAPKKTATPAPAPANQPAKKNGTEERRRMMLLGKKAARTIKADTGAVIVEAGAEITEEVLQKAKLANKFIDLSMNYIP